MAHAMRAILLARATAATLIGRRSIRRASQGRFVPCWRAYRMTAMAPATSSQRKSHRGPRDRLADCGSVVGIVFAALNVGLYVARRHQPHRVAEPLKSAAPVMCARTCLNADEAGGQRREELQQLRSANAFADHYRAASVHSLNLKNRLRDIETDRANLAPGRLPSSGAFRRNHPMAP